MVSTSGSYIKKFENKFKQITGLKNSVAVSTGTNALQLALKISGANNSNEVLLPSLSFIATANAILYNNSNPVFVDIANDFNIDINKTINFLKSRTKIINRTLYNRKPKKNSCSGDRSCFWKSCKRFNKIKKNLQKIQYKNN